MTNDQGGDARRKRVAAMFDNGSSGLEIAAELGLSRGTVAGLIHRLGLRRAKVCSGEQYPRPAKDRRQKPNNAKPRTKRRRDDNSATENVEPVSIGDLEARHCRYIISEQPVKFCGRQKRDGSTWCGEHHRLCTIARSHHG
jgi:hypothetical protein